MTDHAQRIHRPRKQSADAQAAERAVRDNLQRTKPSLEELVRSGDVRNISTMGELWTVHKAAAALKDARLHKGLSVVEAARLCDLSAEDVANLESGAPSEMTLEHLTRYAKTMGKRLLFAVADA